MPYVFVKDFHRFVALLGTLSMIITHPLEVIWKRQIITGENSIQASINQYKNYGIKSFYNGLTWKIVAFLINTSMLWLQSDKFDPLKYTACLILDP